MELTKNNVIEIIELIRVNYDSAYSGLSADEAKLLIDFWYESLKIYPREMVNAGVKNAINCCEYAPRLANIINEIKKLQQATACTNEQLWAELEGVLDKVYRISRYLPYSQYSQWTDEELNKIYDGLSDELKLFVVNVSTLVDIAEMTDDNLSFERARFFKQMPALRQHYYDALDSKEFLLIANNEQFKKIEDKKHN